MALTVSTRYVATASVLETLTVQLRVSERELQDEVHTSLAIEREMIEHRTFNSLVPGLVIRRAIDRLINLREMLYLGGLEI
jgi:hypothetical protein